MAIYRLAASVVERRGTFHVRVVANSHDRHAGVIVREHECPSHEAAQASLEVLLDQVRAAVKALGGEVEGLASRIRPPQD